MTNAELREALDDFGDHLDVALVIETGNTTKTYTEFDLDTRDGVLTLTVEAF